MQPKRRFITAAAALAAALLSLVPAQSATRTESKPYLIGADALLTDCELGAGLDAGLAGACFALDGTETTMTITIDDLTGLPVGGAYALTNASGALLSLGLFCDKTDPVAIIPGATDLTVYVTGPAFTTLNCTAGGTPGVTGTAGTITVDYELGDETEPPGIDEERDCVEPVPAAVDVHGVTDDGGNRDLSVLVLLDGVSQQLGEETFAKAAASYVPIGITMTVTAYEAVTFSGTEASLLNSQAKNHLGGRRPDGVDIVYTLTAKDIQALGQTAVAGLADCLGGVRFPERAFAVGELVPFENLQFGPLTFYRDATARVAAHEIGHLMGGQHHYANCVEDAPGDGLNGEATPCTLMFNSLDTSGEDFSIVNGPVVRGHANEYTG